MSKSNKTDSLQELKDSTIQEILLPKKRSKKDIEKNTSTDTYNAVLDMLATSSSHDSGTDPIGENPVVKPTPPDAHAHVILDSRAGKPQNVPVKPAKPVIPKK